MSYLKILFFSWPFLLVLLVAVNFGFLSPDSINYLTMAQTDGGNICHVGGVVFGLFPCGYPSAIWLTSAISMLDVFYASKLFNVFVLATFFLLFRHIFKSPKMALLFTFNPFNIQIALHTWSESMILLSFAAYCFFLHLIKEEKKVKPIWFAGIFFALLLGCFSRYVFAPYCVFLFVLSYIVINHQVWKILPAFVLVAAFAVINRIYLTDFDMERIPAPESQLLIAFQFIKSSIKYLVFSSPLIILWLVYCRSAKGNSWVGFFIGAGIAYLVLTFILRSMYQFDFFGVRLLGFGYALIIFALLLTIKDKIESLPQWLIALIIIIHMVATTELTILKYAPLTKDNISAIEKTVLLKKENVKPKDYAIIVSDKPRIHPLVAVKGLFIDHPDEEIVFFPRMPNRIRYEIDDIKQRLGDKRCTLYINITKSSVDEYVEQKHKVDFNREEYRYSSSVREFIRNRDDDPDSTCFEVNKPEVD